MTHPERSYAGPDIFGRTFKAEHHQHIAVDWRNHCRLAAADRESARAIDRRSVRSVPALYLVQS